MSKRDRDITDQLLELQGAWDNNARIRQKEASILEIIGKTKQADDVRALELRDLEEARRLGEAIVEKALEGEIDRDKQLPPAALVTKVRGIQAQLHTVTKALFDAAHRYASHQDFAYRELEQLFSALQEQFAHPVEQQRQALAMLDTLEQFLQRFEHLAEDYDPLQPVWLQQADILATLLR